MLDVLTYMVSGISAVALILMLVLVVQIYRTNEDDKKKQ